MKLAQKLAVNYIRARLNLLAVVSPVKAAQRAFDIFCTPFTRNKKPAPAIFEKAERVTINIKNNIVRGFKWNRGGKSRVLILHGFESSCKNFDGYVKALIGKNYEVLAFDAPGHGISGGERITLPLYIHMIEAIYLHFGGIQAFIAHSFGGLAAVHAIEKIPGNSSIRLVLIAPLTDTKIAIDSFFSFLQLGNTVRTAFEAIIREKSGVDPSWFSISRALNQVNGPVLWVQDKFDEVTPFKNASQVINRNLPNVAVCITEGLGHKKIYRNNSVQQKIVAFIDEQQQTPILVKSN